MHRLRHLEQELACAKDETGIRIADASSKFIECPRHARVGVCPEQDLAGPGMPFLGERRMTNSRVMRAILPLQWALRRVKGPMPVRIINHIVEIAQPLLLDKFTQNIDVAVGSGVSSKDVMVRDNDDFARVPYLGVFAEFTLKNPNCAGAADIMG